VGRSWPEVGVVREIQRAGRRFAYRGMLVALCLAAVALLAASGTGSAHGIRVIQFKGHGPKVLPHFRVTAPSTVYWTNSGSFFEIVSYGGYCSDGAVASQAHRGTSYYPAGRYQDLRVSAIGNWTISIRTGVERVGSPIRFTGSGERALPPFVLGSAKTMYWKNAGSVFQIYGADPASAAGTVSTQYTHGKLRLPAGRYRFFVNATAPDEPDGHWRILLR
jgi:hypothetical protein